MTEAKSTNGFWSRPCLVFLPFLAAYLLLVLMLPTNGYTDDEARYLMYAQNILSGFYSPPAPDIQLINGPGYPLFLLPFVALGLPPILTTIANAFLYYFSCILLYRALLFIVPRKTALIFSLAWASYFVAVWYLQYMITEGLTFFFICLFLYLFIRAFRHGEKVWRMRSGILAGLVFGYLLLIKLAFVYVAIALLAGSLILFLFQRKNREYLQVSAIFGTALAVFLPYLIYCFVLTGQFFYFNTNTGDTLYWMSSPYGQEFGDWQFDTDDFEDRNRYVPGGIDSLRAHHLELFREVEDLGGMDKDLALKQAALENIRAHPICYLKNCVYNAGRLYFNLPYSYVKESPWSLLFIFIQSILLFPLLLSLVLHLIYRRKIPVHIWVLLALVVLYLGESVLVSTVIRMFTPVVPILLFWMAFVMEGGIRIRIRPDQSFPD